MKFNLDQIEARLQNFIENGLLPLPRARRQNDLALELVNAMQANLVEDETGLTAPNHYTLTVNPQTLALWQSSPNLLDTLAEMLFQAGLENGVSFQERPVIRLAVDAGLPSDGLRVSAATVRDNGSTTAMLPATARDESSSPPNAFLILNGAETFALRQAVINIGRRLDNDVIISDPRISRAHAQLRGVRGHYVILDLNSSGGTFVNGLRVTQQQLKPGDVISLAGVALVYGEETPAQAGDTSAMLPGERP